MLFLSELGYHGDLFHEVTMVQNRLPSRRKKVILSFVFVLTVLPYFVYKVPPMIKNIIYVILTKNLKTKLFNSDGQTDNLCSL